MPLKLSETKHYHASQALKKIIRKLKPGEILPTVEELKAKLGASHGTVVRSLSMLAEEGFIERPAGRKRYMICQMGDKPLARIAFIRPDYPSSMYENIFREIYKGGKEKNWLFSQVFFHDLNKLDLRSCLAKTDAGILVPTAESIPEHVIKSLQAPDKPTLMLMQHVDDPAINSVGVDDFMVGHLALQELLSLGYRNFIFLQDQPTDSTILIRKRGWRDAIDKMDVSLSNYLELDPNIRSHEDAREKTYHFIREWWKINRGSKKLANKREVIFTSSSRGALAVLRVLREEGVGVPGQVGVASFAGEGNDCEFMSPKLSSIRCNMSEYGTRTVELLDRLLTTKSKTGTKVCIDVKWFERESTRGRS